MRQLRTLRQVEDLARAAGITIDRVHHRGDEFQKPGGLVLAPCPACGEPFDAVVRELIGGGIAVTCGGCGNDLDAVSVALLASTNGHGQVLLPDAALRFYTPAELRELPEPRWLLEPMIPEEAICVLFGESGSYKSFVAVDVCGQVDGLAVYLSAEGSPRRFGDRIHAWEDAAGRPSGILTYPYALDLLQGDADELIRALDALDSAPRLVVVDTLSRYTPGGDENAAADTSRLVSTFDKLRARYACSVFAIHHTGHADTSRERGSSALRGAADVSIRARRIGPLEVRLDCAKMRDAEEFEPLIVRLIPHSGSLVAASAGTRPDTIYADVVAYLAEHPEASQREVEKAIKGKTDDIRAAYKQVRPVRPEQGRTPEQGAPQVGAPIEGAPRAQLPTLATGASAEEGSE
jgi:hypothetical protein